jgi:hypothetical protein
MHLKVLAAHSDAPASMKSWMIISQPPRLYSAAFEAQTSRTQGSPLILAPLRILSSASSASQVKMGVLWDCRDWCAWVDFVGVSEGAGAHELRNIRARKKATAPEADAAAKTFREVRRIGFSDVLGFSSVYLEQAISPRKGGKDVPRSDFAGSQSSGAS